MDLFAAETGIDPVEVRRRNLIPPFSEPFTTSIGTVYDVGDYEGALDRVLEAAELRRAAGRAAAPARRRRPGAARHRGQLLRRDHRTSVPRAAQEVARVGSHPDGGADRLHRHVAARPGPRHGLVDDRADRARASRWSRSTVVHGDTDLVPVGRRHLRARARCSRAAPRCSRSATELVDRPASSRPSCSRPTSPTWCSTGTRAASTSPARRRSVAWADLAAAAATDGDGPLDLEPSSAPGPTFPFGAHVAVVEVDTETGEVRLVRHVACDDAGTVLNPLLFDGQVHGGIAQGVAQALCGGVRLRRGRQPRHRQLRRLHVHLRGRAADFEVVHQETPTPYNPLGAKGVGESGTIGVDPGGAVGGRRRAHAVRGPPPRHAAHPRTGVARDPRSRCMSESEKSGPDYTGKVRVGHRRGVRHRARDRHGLRRRGRERCRCRHRPGRGRRHGEGDRGGRWCGHRGAVRRHEGGRPRARGRSGGRHLRRPRRRVQQCRRRVVGRRCRRRRRRRVRPDPPAQRQGRVAVDEARDPGDDRPRGWCHRQPRRR